MGNRRKVRSKKNSALFAFAIVFLITINVTAKRSPTPFLDRDNTYLVDTPPPVKSPKATKGSKPKTSVADTFVKKSIGSAILRNDSTTVQASSFVDSIRKDTPIVTTDTVRVKLSKDSLTAPVNYAAEDSGVLIVPTKEFILYGKAKAAYTDVEVTAATIHLDQSKQVLKAFGSTDTTGNPLNKPKLVQGDLSSVSDTIVYNTKSQKGLTKGTYLQQGEMYVYANTVKKVNDNTLYAYRGRFTTCNLDTPHFAFRTRRMKMISNKIAVSGPAAPEFEGVPVPIGIPFGIYPLNRGRHSGLLPPQFANNEQFGIGLEGLGYYKVLSDNVDVTVTSNIYSYGGWNVNARSMYLKRYKYTGNLNVAVQNTKILNSAGQSKTEFTKNRSYMLNWSHSRDTKARPGSNFSANVNFGSTQFNRYVANNPVANFQNQLSSSITYSRDWRGKYNLALSANHSQNNQLRLVNLNLPNANFNVVTFYPFQRKEAAGAQRWYEKLGIGYSGNFVNRLDFYDTAFSLRKLLDTARYGAIHNIPITLSLPQLGPVLVAPSISYEERWYGQKVLLAWDGKRNKVDTSISRGIYTARQMQFGLSASTRIFGTAQFPKSNFIKAIRHEIRPTFGFSYKPDLQKGNYYNVQTDSGATPTIRRFSQFEGGIISPFGEGRFGGLNFGLDNVLEMKVKSNKDTTDGGLRKVRLIDGFGFSGSYNLFPSPTDSFPLSNILLYARSTLFEKINITANANLDPYVIDARGIRRPRFVLQDKAFKLGRITNGSLAVSTSLSSKSKDGKSDKERLKRDEYMTPEEQQRQLDYVRNNPAEYTDFNIPWTLQLSYSLSFSRQLSADFKRLETRTFSNVSINGDFSLTPRWKMGGNSYYDFTTKQIQTLTMFITREMHCWQMSINVTPVGLYRSFSITINPKSGILRDLKINRSRYFYQ